MKRRYYLKKRGRLGVVDGIACRHMLEIVALSRGL